MRRGKSQVLFHYLPECIVDYSGTNTIAKVTSWDAIKTEAVNEERILSEVVRRLDQFRRKRGFPTKPDANNLVFLEPKGVEVDLFPLTFECRKCRKVRSYDNVNSMRRDLIDYGYRCKCGGQLKQFELVHYHNCGKVESLQVAPCRDHGDANITLEMGGSGKIANWYWRCGICKRETGRIARMCRECQERMITSPFGRGQVFYPHSISIINTKGLDAVEGYSKDETLALSIAWYLDYISKDEYEAFQRTDAPTIKSDNLAEIKKLLAGKVDPGIQKELERLMGVDPDSSSKTSRDASIERVLSRLQPRGNELAEIASSLMSFQDAINLPGAKTVERIIRESRDRGDPNFTRIQTFPDKLSRAGISEAFVVDDLPVVSAVFGYSRVSADPAECILRAFPLDEKYPDTTPMYVNPTKTEGIVLVFDRWRILRWIEENGLIPDIPQKEDIASLKLWFLNNVNPDKISVYNTISPGETYTKLVYTLIHTMTHMFIRKGAGQIGIDKDSLAEVLYPNIPASVIYTNNDHDYQIGGMHTLFETGIIPWMDMAVESAETCLYDPVCISSDASCHACSHISELSCEHFNRDLDRRYLIGGKRQGEGSDRLIGFWEPEFMNKSSG